MRRQILSTLPHRDRTEAERLIAATFAAASMTPRPAHIQASTVRLRRTAGSALPGVISVETPARSARQSCQFGDDTGFQLLEVHDELTPAPHISWIWYSECIEPRVPAIHFTPACPYAATQRAQPLRISRHLMPQRAARYQNEIETKTAL